MPAYVVVQVARARARRPARGGAPALTGTGLKQVLTEHDATLLPGPEGGSAEGEAPEFMTIAVPDMERANRLAAALRGMDGVATAYAKPGEELP
jgi:hypothetical protein